MGAKSKQGSLSSESHIYKVVLRKMGAGRTVDSVIGDVWRKGHSSVGAGAPVREFGRRGISIVCVGNALMRVLIDILIVSTYVGGFL